MENVTLQEAHSDTPSTQPPPLHHNSGRAAAIPASTAVSSAPFMTQKNQDTAHNESRKSFFSWIGCMGIIALLTLGCCGLLCGAAFFISLDGLGKLHQEHYAGPPKIEGGIHAVAIIHIEGTISETDGFMAKQLRQAREDSRVKAVVLRINSPGGSVSASDFLYNEVNKLRNSNKPVVVSMGGVCASGGYYIAMGVGNKTEKTIYAEPTTWTGSIGVIIPHYDLSELAKKWGVTENSIKSHHLKGMGSMIRPFTDEERNIMQDLVNSSFSQFKKVVQSGRKRFLQAPEELDKIATGQVFTSQTAKENGLVDEIGYLDDAIHRVMELANLSRDTTEIFSYKQNETFMNALMGATTNQNDPAAIGINALRKSSVPQAYYLWSTMPGL